MIRDIRPFVKELRQMIDDEIRSWTIIEMNAYDSKKNTSLVSHFNGTLMI